MIWTKLEWQLRELQTHETQMTPDLKLVDPGKGPSQAWGPSRYTVKEKAKLKGNEVLGNQ